jgi:hypothetical protein
MTGIRRYKGDVEVADISKPPGARLLIPREVGNISVRSGLQIVLCLNGNRRYRAEN